MAQIAGRIGVSRYKVGGEQVTSHDTQSLKKTTGAVSRYKQSSKPDISHGTEFLLRSLERSQG